MGKYCSFCYSHFPLWQESEVALNSVTADGDVAISAIVEKHYGHSVSVNRDPNHYAKGLLNNVKNLSITYPALADIAPLLKAHFLVGVKMHSQNEQAFRLHMKAFIPHITDQSHSLCQHPRGKVTKRLDAVDHQDALEQLHILIESYLEDSQRYLHGFSTIQLESLNGTACKRVNKERNWTVMYSALFDAAILERNEGRTIMIDIYQHIGLPVSGNERARWLKIVTRREQRDEWLRLGRGKQLRKKYKHVAIAETGRRRDQAVRFSKASYKESPAQIVAWVGKCINGNRCGELRVRHLLQYLAHHHVQHRKSERRDLLLERVSKHAKSSPFSSSPSSSSSSSSSSSPSGLAPQANRKRPGNFTSPSSSTPSASPSKRQCTSSAQKKSRTPKPAASTRTKRAPTKRKHEEIGGLPDLVDDDEPTARPSK